MIGCYFFRLNYPRAAVRKPKMRLMVYHDQYLFQWDVNRNIARNEKLTAEQKIPVGYFTFYKDKWVFVN